MEVSVVLWALLRLLIIVLLAGFVFYCFYIKSMHMKYDHIPGAPRDRGEEYGPIVRFNVFHKVVLLVLSPEGVKEYLMSPEYPKDPMIYSGLYEMCGVRFLGNGLTATLDYNHWHKQRKIMDPAFKKSYLVGLIETFNDQAEELMKELEKKADGESKVDVMSLLRRLTLDIIAKVGFGLELKTLHDDKTPFPHAVNMITIGLANLRVPFFEYMPWNRKVVKEIQESVRLLRRTGKECIEQRKKSIQNEDYVPLDILTQILKNAAQEGDCDDENMLDNFVNFFFAGHETSANQLSFTIMELARHPEILAKLQAEVDDIIGVKGNISYKDLANLKYLSQVLKESLRLYPPAVATLRWTGKEKIINGIKIPADTTLIFCTYVMGRMERYFRDPLIFDPERFRKDQPRPHYSYFPFSLGPRSCIGQTFAQMEAKVVMAKFVQRFEFQLVPPQSFKILDAGTLRPLDGVVCRLKQRPMYSCKKEMKY
ncbi:cholesterol 24-hydroxylase-like isoform X2 [Sceloporus undulatus]|uniref:cholesterol 24-hydroxylase-like isoform X2 n=1 Tax=Sceloporus undulatus TaxID=8520 RepID=UPI001C4C6562|nr:cholesterol 24-hydroxylase-like isoform X2 [Sceloporus undulatus]